MAQVYGPIAGVDLTATPAGTGSSNDEGSEFTLGTIVSGADGQLYQYVHASGAITQYDFVGIDEDFEAGALTKAMVDDGHQIGCAQVAFADNDFGWVCIKGANISGRLGASATADTALYSSGTAGVLDDTATSQTAVRGVVAVVGNTSSGVVAEEVLLTWPRSATF